VARDYQGTCDETRIRQRDLAFVLFGSRPARCCRSRLGAVTLIGVILAGQALASLVVDHYGMVGFDEHPATPGRISGMLLIALGVLFVRLF
jgi:uncharacterized membrane protein YdcZ (DUF606 family)